MLPRENSVRSVSKEVENAPQANETRSMRPRRIPETVLKEQLMFEAMIGITRSLVDREFEVFQTADKGKGLRTNQEFYEGQFLLEFKGEWISKSEGLARERQLEEEGNDVCYIFFVGNKCVDATNSQESKSRYINHSITNANAKAKVMIVNNEWHLAFFATRKISAGEEILVDYSDRREDVLAGNEWLRH
ncbi:unnamed protein product [Caenorhabditis sp. 36 PRJEB53466]|nr:unnamed protein product [Caenorhabditis sp. 36 PRJEB53466]